MLLPFFLLRDDTKNGCVADYIHKGSISAIFSTRYKEVSGHINKLR